MIGDSVEVAKAFNMIKEEGPGLGLVLNVGKTELFWPSPDPRIEGMKLFPNDIARPKKGVKLLGGGVSRDEEFLNHLASKRAHRSRELMEAVAELNDPQCELILLRACIGVSKLYFALRTCLPESFEDAEDIFDSALRKSLEHIVTGGNGGFGDIQWRMATLPVKHGGLGVLAIEDVKYYAYLASFLQSLELQGVIIQNEQVGLGASITAAVQSFRAMVGENELLDEGLKGNVPPKMMHKLADTHFSQVFNNLSSEFALEPRQAAVIECLRSPHAQDFLYTLPIEGLGQTMSPSDYRAVLSYRLMIPMFTEGQICHGCNKAYMDCYGDHAIHCKHDPGVKFRHDMVRDGLFDILRRAGIAVKREANVGTIDEKKEVSLRPADLLVYSWLGGKHTCVDITGSSPLVGFCSGGFDRDKVLKLAVRKKYDKHDKACHDLGYEFLPFGFSTFGGLCEEALVFMMRVEKVAHNHLQGYKSTKFVFSRLGFLIQRGIAAQLVSRLPINFVSD